MRAALRGEMTTITSFAALRGRCRRSSSRPRAHPQGSRRSAVRFRSRQSAAGRQASGLYHPRDRRGVPSSLTRTNEGRLRPSWKRARPWATDPSRTCTLPYAHCQSLRTKPLTYLQHIARPAPCDAGTLPLTIPRITPSPCTLPSSLSLTFTWSHSVTSGQPSHHRGPGPLRPCSQAS